MSTNASDRPHTISELAERARTFDDHRTSVKAYLRLADQLRRDGKEHSDKNDLEKAFVAFARSASIVLEKIPHHREYQEVLTPSQRSNLALNGQEMLDSLGRLKPVLVNRYERWLKHHPDLDQTPSAQDTHQITSDMQNMQMNVDQANKESNKRRLRQEAEAFKQQREEIARRTEGDRRLLPESRSDVARGAVNSARIAAGLAPPHTNGSGPLPYSSQTSYHDPSSAQRQQREELRREGSNQQRKTEDQPTRYASSSLAHPTYRASPATTTFSGVQMPAVQVATSTVPNSQPPSSYYEPNPMPLESPTRYEGDSTDSEALSNPHRVYRRNSKRQGPPQESMKSSRPQRTAYPPPVTTTSPPPSDRIDYPQLMSQHQKKQGYVPSLNSMFIPASNPSQAVNPASFSFEAPPNSQLYSNILPQPSVSASYQSRIPEPSHQHHSSSQYEQYAIPQSRPPPITPSPSKAPPPISTEPERPGSKVGQNLPELKTVSLPRECLPRFLAIAKVNTAMNRETCGLLLGKPKGSKFVVTTLLIPKQHSTSDTCTMDEEELVLMFTEERNLITLGWIHTHPSQSCFMSSVDLHTHSGFQRMLPESFAVVCAPQSTPNFGIFRLTDPPGLQTVLNCKAKEAFHPHPDVPIYTDADKGHVRMKDGALEIVDLR